MSVLKLLAKENYITYNKALAKKVGVNGALVFGELCSVAMMTKKGNSFFCLKDKIAEDTCLGRSAIDSAIKTLVEFGLLKVERHGVPAKNYYQIDEACLLKLLDDDEETSEEKAPREDEKPKRKSSQKPLTEREPKNELEEIEKIYLENYAKLYSEKIVNTEKPIMNWTACRALLKRAISQYGKDVIKKAVQDSIGNGFVVQRGYSLSMILSTGVLNGLVNGNNKNKTAEGFKTGSGIDEQVDDVQF